MFTQKTGYPIAMVVSLVAAAAIAFTALVHAYSEIQFFW
jgi:hypothetical protein